MCKGAVKAAVIAWLVSMFAAEAALADPGGKSCTRSSTLAHGMSFATTEEARKALGKRDEWARQLSPYDLGIRQKTAAPTTLAKFLDFAADNAVPWTEQERQAWQPIIAKLSTAMADLDLHLPNVLLVKTTGSEELGALAYTRQRAIFMSQTLASRAIDHPNSSFFFLAHELFHVLSRDDSKLRDDMHALLGFATFRHFDYPSELEPFRVSNPDSFDYGAGLTVQTATGTANVVPIFQVPLPLKDAILLPDVFAVLEVDLVAVDIETGGPILDGNGKAVVYGFDNTNWIPLMLRNSDFIIQPQEVMADNFGLLMQWRANGVLPAGTPSGFPINDVDLLIAIEDRLVGGCVSVQ